MPSGGGDSPSRQPDTSSTPPSGIGSENPESKGPSRQRKDDKSIVHRRSHAKSRTGCRTCKARRIKCDEHRPSCRNCNKHAVVCDFLQPSTASSPSSSAFGPGSAPSAGGDLNVIDLELMHNFTNFTYATLSGDPAARQLLKTTVVQLAFDYDYILRAVLAISGLHLAHYRTRNRDLYISRAMHHHQVASSTAVGLMADLKPEDCENLHLFTILTVYFALGCPRNEADLSPESPLVPHWISLLHGREPIFRGLDHENYRGVLLPLFRTGRRRIQLFSESNGPQNANLLADLQGLIHRNCSEADLIPIYDQVIEWLRPVLGLAFPAHTTYTEAADGDTSSRGSHASTPADARTLGDGFPRTQECRGEGQQEMRNSPDPSSTGTTTAAAANFPTMPATRPVTLEAWDVLPWHGRVNRDFFPLLDANPPKQEAVAIFAHFLVLLKKLESQWWLEGWPDHLMGKAWAALDAEHRQWIGWPMEELGWIPPR